MKKLLLVGGTMGIGKTTVCQSLKKSLDRCVFLDGDWCWDMHPFVVNDETKRMVLNNIIYQLNQFLKCSYYDYVIFCWVMHQQDIIDEIINGIEEDVDIYSISLVCSEETLKEHIQKDIDRGIRQEDVLERSFNRLKMYQELKTIKIDVSGLSIDEVIYKIEKSMNI